jgi:hypothetical protein
MIYFDSDMSKSTKTVEYFDWKTIARNDGYKNDHIIFNVGTTSLEARNIRLVNIITYIIEESKLISENMSPNVIHTTSDNDYIGTCKSIYHTITATTVLFSVMIARAPLHRV